MENDGAAAVRRGLAALRETWAYDPDVPRHIDADMRALWAYRDARVAHVSLEREARGHPEMTMDVRLADDRRTRAHNEAIRAAADLNRWCALAGLDPIAPVCPEGVDPYGFLHRNAVARFVADALGLDGEGLREMGL